MRYLITLLVVIRGFILLTVYAGIINFILMSSIIALDPELTAIYPNAADWILHVIIKLLASFILALLIQYLSKSPRISWYRFRIPSQKLSQPS